MSSDRDSSYQYPEEALENSASLLLDGAMGTMIQTYGLQEADYRGARFADLSPRYQGQQRPAGIDTAADYQRHS